MLNELLGACERGEFYVDYQPISNMQSHEMLGVEALLRWKSPRLGEASPDRLMPMLEKYDGILNLGERLLHTARHQARLWNQASAKPCRVSVNA